MGNYGNYSQNPPGRALWTGERLQYKIQLPSLWEEPFFGQICQFFKKDERSQRRVCALCKYRMGQSYGNPVYHSGHCTDPYVWITALTLGIVSIFVSSLASKMDTVLMIFLPATAISLIMAIWGNYMRKKIKRFRSYVKTLNGKPYGTIKDLAKSVRKPEKFVRKDLKKMIKKQMFLEGHLDKRETCLIASDEAYDQYLAAEKNAEQIQKEAAEDPRKKLSEEAKKVIEEGDRYIEEIRRSNDAIPGVEVSNKMYHLENVIRRIFQRVEQHPELINDLHKLWITIFPLL